MIIINMTIPFYATHNYTGFEYELSLGYVRKSHGYAERRRRSTFSIPRLRSATALCTWGFDAKWNPNVEDVPQLQQNQTCVILNIFDFSRTHAKSIREHNIDIDPTYVGLK